MDVMNIKCHVLLTIKFAYHYEMHSKNGMMALRGTSVWAELVWIMWYYVHYSSECTTPKRHGFVAFCTTNFKNSMMCHPLQ